MSVCEGVSFFTGYFDMLYKSKLAKRLRKFSRMSQAQSLCLEERRWRISILWASVFVLPVDQRISLQNLVNTFLKRFDRRFASSQNDAERHTDDQSDCEKSSDTSDDHPLPSRQRHCFSTSLVNLLIQRKFFLVFRTTKNLFVNRTSYLDVDGRRSLDIDSSCLGRTLEQRARAHTHTHTGT